MKNLKSSSTMDFSKEENSFILANSKVLSIYQIDGTDIELLEMSCERQGISKYYIVTSDKYDSDNGYFYNGSVFSDTDHLSYAIEQFAKAVLFFKK